MSNQRVIRAAEAVNDLRKALELWCDRGDEPVTLGVRRAASNALAAADSAIEELWKIRRETAAEVRAYNAASAARTDALLSEVTPPAPVPALRTEIGPMPLTEPWAPTVKYPEGTPEYAAYAAELRTELTKFANGEAPYDAGRTYRCGDCGRVFPIDPADPMTAHGDYLDHMEDHEAEDLADDELDKASEANQ